MTENNIPKTPLQKPKFEWNKINSQFRFKQGSKYTRVPLKPSLKIQQNAQNSKIQTKIHIDTQKSLQYENQIGWNWHKSSNLPIISIKLEIRDVEKDILLLPPANLEAKIYAAKFVVNTFEKDQVAYLEDVGIRGPNNIQLRQGCGFFNGVRFSSTSYNNQGVKFYLVIVVYLNDENSDMQSNIICSLLSPPIFVDSRKSARDYQQKRFLSFVELFDPTEFSKLFKKRQTRNNSNDFQTQIANNFDGLYNYLTAPNIRHKVKHPLFLSVKFSNVFKIFYNKNHQNFQQKKVTATQVIKKLQKKLVKEVGGQKKLKKNDDVNKKLFIISMVTNCNQSKKAKVMNALQYLDCKSIFIAQFQYMITQSFANIDTIQNIVQAYAQVYPVLQILSEKQISARKTREIQYQRSQKDMVVSPKQQIQDGFVKRQHQQNNFNCYKSQRYYPNRQKNENDSQQDNFSEDGSNTKTKYRFKGSEPNTPKTFNPNEHFSKKQTNLINQRIDTTLLQNNLIHPNSSLNNSLNLMNQIQDMGLSPILENPMMKQDLSPNMCLLGQNMPNLPSLSSLANLASLSQLPQPFPNNIGMHNMNNMNTNLQNYYQFQLSRIRNNENRHFILKDLLDQVVSKSGMLNKMLYDNEILKNKILMELNLSNNQMFHEMNYMASLQNDRNLSNLAASNRSNVFQNQHTFEDNNNFLMAGFKQISSQFGDNLQRHHSLQESIRQEKANNQNDNIITIRNSSSFSEGLLNSSSNHSKTEGKVAVNQGEQPMLSSMQCKFEENVFHFEH